MEAKIRSWVEGGTVKNAKMITGGFFYDPAEDDPATADGVIIFDQIGDGKVAVPTHVFKIVVGQGSDNALKATAFIAPNKKPPTGWKFADAIVAIDWLKERAGLNFMPDLDPGDEVTLEATPLRRGRRERRQSPLRVSAGAGRNADLSAGHQRGGHARNGAHVGWSGSMTPDRPPRTGAAQRHPGGDGSCAPAECRQRCDSDPRWSGGRRGRIQPAKDWNRTARTLYVRTAKGGRPRTLPLDDRATGALECLDRRPKGDGWGTFTSAPVARMFHAAVARAGMHKYEPLVPYALRQTFATHAYALSGDLKATSEAIGHKTLKQTERYVEAAVSQQVGSLFSKIATAAPRRRARKLAIVGRG